MSNNQIEKPLIKCFIHFSDEEGHITHVSVSDNSEDSIEGDSRSTQKEIVFEEKFIKDVFTPIYCYVAETFSHNDAMLVVKSLIETGIQELKNRYGSYLYHKDNNKLDTFHPVISIRNTETMPYLVEIHEKLVQNFPEFVVVRFCVDLVLYGASVVKEMPDTKIFGPKGYQRDLN